MLLSAVLFNLNPSAADFNEQQYTVEPKGFWKRLADAVWVAPRSSGVPMNPVFRNPPPGANDPKDYDDPVTIPAGDIADNPYWKRDVRRAYPRLSVVNQSDVAGLLTVGSAAAPKENVLQIGDAGSKQLVALKEESDKGGLGMVFFNKNKNAAAAVLGADGLPPLPASLGQNMSGKSYDLNAEQTYENK